MLEDSEVPAPENQIPDEKKPDTSAQAKPTASVDPSYAAATHDTDLMKPEEPAHADQAHERETTGRRSSGDWKKPERK